MLRMFQEGGWFMYVTAFMGAVAIVAAIVALVVALTTPKRQPSLIFAIGATAMALLVPVAGGIGYALSMRTVYAVMPMVDAADREMLLAQGTSEAFNNVTLGLLCGAVPCLLAFAALARAATRPAG